MELSSPKIIKEILEKYEAKPKKGLGQNFLIDKNILDKIILASDLKKEDVVLEIGPGIGTLTKELAKNAGRVIAIEKDKKMVEILQEILGDYKNIKIENCDILEFIENCPALRDPAVAGKIENYKVVANIPYYITSPVIRMFLEAENKPKEIILMVQKEVAQRICPSTSLRTGDKPKMSLLSVSVQFYAKPEILFYVSKNCFLPSPKVDSAVIKITPKKNVNILGANKALSNIFFKIVKAGFSQKRKQLINNFITALKMQRSQAEKWLLENNIKPTQRAETLSVQDWENLAKSYPQV